jgi:hypothetical protein
MEWMTTTEWILQNRHYGMDTMVETCCLTGTGGERKRNALKHGQNLYSSVVSMTSLSVVYLDINHVVM